jgi:hypothetical protein
MLKVRPGVGEQIAGDEARIRKTHLGHRLGSGVVLERYRLLAVVGSAGAEDRNVEHQ